MRKSLAIHGIHMESKGCVVYLMDILANTSCALWTSASSLILEVVVMGAAKAVNGRHPLRLGVPVIPSVA